ncbi:MAG TPA: 4'-phosphopantetheinyl transferase superfamily protein [Rhodothermales bacterium]|nr:4'-phosphopantetheinyl transferase superfamily protein [Rhodothermales bacterium]
MWAADLDSLPIATDLYPLSEDEKRRTARFRGERLQHRFAAGRSLLRHVLGDLLNLPPDRVAFHYGSLGKPTLDPLAHAGAGPLHFNVSHCEEQIVIAATLTAPIGVDVEKLRPLSDEPELASRFFESGEIAEYFSLPAALRNQGFFNAWTRKEALLKARGDGLQTPLDSFRVSLDPRTPCEVRAFTSLPESPSDWSLISLSPSPRSIAAIAIRANRLRLHLARIPPPIYATL